MTTIIRAFILATGLAAGAMAAAETRTVFLVDGQGARLAIAKLETTGADYTLSMLADPFSNHFLSMRPFKCLDGPTKTWCHVPYPYENARDLSQGPTDLEYDLLFIWKSATDYGINMWNGVYYKIDAAADGSMTGVMHEMDMDILAVPPPDGEMRPIRPVDLEKADPDSHWLPHLVIE
ncbi:hypothetical protein [Tropicimonas sp. S265A]|uniref:hypothetical protein n=1 Tax=Tropicimonas sp. S265A TaxID=3415134 RepID=UPI003C7A7CA9